MSVNLSIEEIRHSLPNATRDQAIEKFRKAEGVWNSKWTMLHDVWAGTAQTTFLITRLKIQMVDVF